LIYYLRDILYADDWATLYTNLQSIQLDLDILDAACSRYGLRFKPAKCKLLALSHDDDNIPILPDIMLHGTAIEWVHSFKHLGIHHTASTPYGDFELHHRCNNAYRAFFANKEYYFNKQISMRARLLFFREEILPILLFACQVWTYSESKLRKIDTVQKKMLLWIVGRFRHDRVRSSTLYTWLHHHGIKLYPATITAATLKLRFFSKLHDPHATESATIKLLFSELLGPRPPNSPFLHPDVRAILDAKSKLNLPDSLLSINATSDTLSLHAQLDQARNAAFQTWVETFNKDAEDKRRKTQLLQPDEAMNSYDHHLDECRVAYYESILMHKADKLSFNLRRHSRAADNLPPLDWSFSTQTPLSPRPYMPSMY
jgi:hypothetical protein